MQQQYRRASECGKDLRRETYKKSMGGNGAEGRPSTRENAATCHRRRGYLAGQQDSSEWAEDKGVGKCKRER